MSEKSGGAPIPQDGIGFLPQRNERAGDPTLRPDVETENLSR